LADFLTSSEQYLLISGRSQRRRRSEWAMEHFFHRWWADSKVVAMAKGLWADFSQLR
jgi:hypothetical protein